jgi:SP family general alpha glucoside:H+ symporter-like MFS transporter
MGQFIAAGVNRGCVQRPDQWAYRIPFAIQWVWPIPIMVGVFLAPESPWWHVRKGDKAGAKAALLRLTSPDKDPNFNEMEKNMSEGTRWTDLFKGTDLRRTEIVCFTWIAQTICGTNIMGYLSVYGLEISEISS